MIPQNHPLDSLKTLFKRAAYSRIGLALEKAAFPVVLTIGRYCFADSVVPIRLQQNLHRVFKWRPDVAPYVERFVRFMSKGTEGGQEAC